MNDKQPRPYVLSETDYRSVLDTDVQVCLLPWGATEAHNYHLPYCTDVTQCDRIAEESSRIAWEAGEKVMALPTIPFGVNTGQADVKLDINLSPSTQFAMLKDITETLVRHGVPKLAIMNGHGGNDFRQMVRELQFTRPEIFIVTFDWYTSVDRAPHFDEAGCHAGEMETSLMLHFAPELVKPLSEAGPGREKRIKLKGVQEGWVFAQREWPKATEDTGMGNPVLATAEKGERFFRVVTKHIGSFLIELAQADINDLYEE
jgi:creatinine amidohydrolase